MLGLAFIFKKFALISAEGSKKRNTIYKGELKFIPFRLTTQKRRNRDSFNLKQGTIVPNLPSY